MFTIINLQLVFPAISRHLSYSSSQQPYKFLETSIRYKLLIKFLELNSHNKSLLFYLLVNFYVGKTRFFQLNRMQFKGFLHTYYRYSFSTSVLHIWCDKKKGLLKKAITIPLSKLLNQSSTIVCIIGLLISFLSALVF